MTNIFTAVVKSNGNVFDNGFLECVKSNSRQGNPNNTFDEEIIAVRYTSPYNPSIKHPSNSYGGGFTAPPQQGDVILACQPDNDYEFYYMSTVMGKQLSFKDGIDNKPSGHRRYLRKPDQLAVDTSIGFSHPYGTAIEITNREKDESRDYRMELMSGGDSWMSLDDTPGRQRVHLQSGPRTKITLTTSSNNNDEGGPDSLLMTGNLNTKLSTNQGDLVLGVNTTGGNLSVKNDAAPANPRGLPTNRTGDVSLESTFNAIEQIAGRFNILPTGVQTQAGPVFPAIYQEANQVNPSSYIQQRAGGKIEILQISPAPGANGWGIDIVAMGDINIKSQMGNVNIDGLNINLQGNPAPIPRIPTKDGLP
jgi:hypothetical protein